MKITSLYLTEKEIKERVECFEYIKDKNGQRVGIVVMDKLLRIGWSLYNFDHEPLEMTLDHGLVVALSRASHEHDLKKELEDKYKKYLSVSDKYIKKDIKPRIILVQNYLDKMYERRENKKAVIGYRKKK